MINFAISGSEFPELDFLIISLGLDLFFLSDWTCLLGIPFATTLVVGGAPFGYGELLPVGRDLTSRLGVDK